MRKRVARILLTADSAVLARPEVSEGRAEIKLIFVI